MSLLQVLNHRRDSLAVGSLRKPSERPSLCAPGPRGDWQSQHPESTLSPGGLEQRRSRLPHPPQALQTQCQDKGAVSVAAKGTWPPSGS